MRADRPLAWAIATQSRWVKSPSPPRDRAPNPAACGPRCPADSTVANLDASLMGLSHNAFNSAPATVPR